MNKVSAKKRLRKLMILFPTYVYLRYFWDYLSGFFMQILLNRIKCLAHHCERHWLSITFKRIIATLQSAT